MRDKDGALLPATPWMRTIRYELAWILVRPYRWAFGRWQVTEGQIAKMKEMVRLAPVGCGIWWIEDSRCPCRRIIRIGKAPCKKGDEPEPCEVAFLEGPEGKYVALSEMDPKEFVVGHRLLPFHFGAQDSPQAILPGELISEEIQQ